MGRPIEAGEAGDPNIDALDFTDHLNDYTYPANNIKRDYMKTYYEGGYSGVGIDAVFANGQQNLRNRIGAVEQRMAQYEPTALNTQVKVSYGTEVILITSYSYDFHGNVNELVQTNSSLVVHQHQHKYMKYEYDLISGNVKQVRYQEGEADEWQHKYHYDANNRLVRAWTSDDGEEWEMDAKYFYYLHGSLARTETGHDKVQGTDYAFNMQGWLKGVNSTTLQTNRDLGGDANSTDLDKYSGADVYGFTLGYFDGDYTPISGTAFANTDALITANGAYGNLYNGNISHMVTAMKDDDEAMIDVLGNIYTYDQLQRIKSSTSYWVSNQATYISNNSFTGAVNYNSGGYAEAYWFDKNGNIDSLTRKNSAGTFYDNFSYNYDGTKKNRLLSVDDAGGNSSVMTDDVDDQSANNYSYNAIGQLISDTQENITAIEWTVTGKVRKVTQSDALATEFIYDAFGNRVMKIEKGMNYVDAVYTYYVYDASGNVISTYKREVVLNALEVPDDYNDELQLSERYIYGSKRLGSKNENRVLTDYDFTPSQISSGFYFDETYQWGYVYSSSDTNYYDSNFEKEKRKVGEKYYEFSEHRGNVLEVVTDRKIRNTGETAYVADVISYSDYSPYGTILDLRSGSTDLYRFSFQGQEDDPEIKGEGNSVNYKYRMHDPRIGRFFAEDPLAPKYPELTPYQFSSNRPIDFVELEGLEGVSSDQAWKTTEPGVTATAPKQYDESTPGYWGLIDGQNTLVRQITEGPNAGNYVGTVYYENGTYEQGVYVVGKDLISGNGFNISSTTSSEELDYVKTINSSINVPIFFGTGEFRDDGTFELYDENAGLKLLLIDDYDNNARYLINHNLMGDLFWDESGNLAVSFYVETTYEYFGPMYYGGAGGLEWFVAPAGVARTPSVLGHIFRNAPGHVNPSSITSVNRYIKLFEGTAATGKITTKILTADAIKAGVTGYVKTYRNGKEVWVMVNKNNQIFNAGVNQIPK